MNKLFVMQFRESIAQKALPLLTAWAAKALRKRLSFLHPHKVDLDVADAVHNGSGLPTPATQATARPALRTKDIAWAEGLRGIAALGVMSNHLTLCYANYLFRPCCAPVGGETSEENEDHIPHLFQLPFLRLVAAGETFVALFFVLTGFTAGYKALRYARSGQCDRAYGSIAVSSFRRIPRLFFPATLATILSWAVCNVGGYQTARHGDAWWMIALTPTMSYGKFGQSFVDIWWGIWTAWMPYGVSPYDQPQWALQYFVEAGLMVFLAVLGTARLSTTWRVIVLSAWALWSAHLSVAIRDPYVGYCTLFGMVLAELNLYVSSKKFHQKLMSNLFGFAIIPVALFFMSYPRDEPEKASWSHTLRDLGEIVLPTNDNKYKAWVSLGCLVMMFGIIFTSWVQKALSVGPMVWLGKISFPLYLMHGTFIRSLFAWILFAGQSLEPSARDKDLKKYPLPSKGWIAFSVISMLIPLLICSHLWVKHLEPVFDDMIRWMERIMIKSDDGGPTGLERIRSTLRAILLVVQKGGLPSSHKDTAQNPDCESGALLQEMDELEEFTPTGSYGDHTEQPTRGSYTAEPQSKDEIEYTPTTLYGVHSEETFAATTPFHDSSFESCRGALTEDVHAEADRIEKPAVQDGPQK